MTSERRVRHLALDAERREDVARAMILLEDAFQTATLPAVAPGAVLAIKHIDLGCISIRRPSQAVARRLTERLRQIGARALRYDHPAAGAAQAVYWPERSAVNASLARRLLEGPAPREWFWPSAAPDWNPRAPLEHTLAALLLPAAMPAPREVPPLVAAARVLRELAVAGVATRALVRLSTSATAAHVQRWAAPVAVPAAAEGRASAAAVSFERLPIAWRALLAWVALNLAPSDPRAVWVAVCAIVSERPELSATPRLPVLVRQLQAEARRAGIPGARQPLRGAAGESSAVAPTVLDADHAPETRVLSSERTTSARASCSATSTATPSHSVAAEQRRLPEPLPREAAAREGEAAPRQKRDPFWARLPLPPLDAPALTQFAGLLLTLPVLARLGLDALLASDPVLLEQAFAREILFSLLDRMGAEPLEPMRRALAPSLEPLPLSAAREIAFGTALEAETAAAARRDGWAEAVARQCETWNLSLEFIVRRRGIVAASATHIDIAFPLGELQLQIRRHALDVTPGFVAWIGRVVTFHYLEDDDFEARARELQRASAATSAPVP